MRTTQKTLSILFLIIALCGLSALPQRGAQADPVNPGTGSLAAWWSLDETSGTRNDSHGANHLTDNNTVTYTTGKKSNAASFVAANVEYLSRADPFTLGQMTIGAWVYLPNKSTAYTTFSKWNSSTSEREILCFYDLGSDRFRCVASNDGTAVIGVNADNFGSPSINTWYFIVCSYDGTNLAISVNAGTSNTTALSGFKNGTAPFMIGYRADSLAPMNGNVDEVFYYNRSLSADEISWLYNSGTGRSYSETSATPTPTNTPSNTATFTPSNTATFTPSNTATNTPPNSATFTPSNTATFTPSKTPTPSNTPTFTNTVPGPTSTFTDTPTPSETPTATATATETMTPTITFTPSVTSTPTITRTPGNFATAFWDGAITYGDSANVIVTALLCLIVLVGLMSWLVTTNLQRKRK